MIVPGSCFIPFWTAETPACDPYWNNVVLAMHLDDDLYDLKAYTVTNYGVTLSTVQKPSFAANSAYFDGSARLAVTDSADFDVTGDFMLGIWIYTATPAAWKSFFSTITLAADSLANTFDVYTDTDGQVKAKFYDGAESPTTIAGGAVAANTWTWVEVSKTGTTIKVSQGDGTGAGTATWNHSILAKGITIGNAWDTATRGWIGYLSDVLFTKAARPSSVPAQAFTANALWVSFFGPAYFDIFTDLTWTGAQYEATPLGYPRLHLKAGTIPSNTIRCRFTFDANITHGVLEGPTMKYPFFAGWLMSPEYDPSGANVNAIAELSVLGAWKTSAQEEFFTFDGVNQSTRIPFAAYTSLTIKNFEVLIPDPAC